MERRRVLHVAAGGGSVARPADALEGTEFAVATTTSVAEAKWVLGTEDIDCVLSELQLEDGTAFDLLEWIRANRPSLPFVLLTPETATEVIERAVDAGVTDFVSNLVPAISTDLLAMRLRNAIRARGGSTDEAEPAGQPTAEPQPDPLFQVIRAALDDYPDGSTTRGSNGHGRAKTASDRSMVDAVNTALLTADESGTGSRPDVDETRLLWYSLGRPSSEHDGVGEHNGADPGATDTAAAPSSPGETGGADRSVADTDGGTHRFTGETGESPFTELVSEYDSPEGGWDRGTTQPNEPLEDAGSGDGPRQRPGIPNSGDAVDSVPPTSDPGTEAGGNAAGRPVGPSDPAHHDSDGGSRSPGLDGGVGAGHDTTRVDSGAEEPTGDEAFGGLSSGYRSTRSPAARTGRDTETPVEEFRDEGFESVGLRDMTDEELIEHAIGLETDTEASTAEATGDAQSVVVSGDESSKAGSCEAGTGEESTGDAPTMEQPPNTDAAGAHQAGSASESAGEAALEPPQAAFASVQKPETAESSVELDQSGTGADGDGESGVDPADAAESHPAGSGSGQTALESNDLGQSEASTANPPPGSTADGVADASADESGSDGPGLDELSAPAPQTPNVETDRSPDPAEADSQGSFGEFGTTEEYNRPAQLDLRPGTSVLVQCGSQDDRRQAACADLLGPSDVADRNVLLVRYRRMDESRLETIATSAAHTKLISVGYSQPVPNWIDDQVETVKINNPNDLTRLGIVVTATIDNWATNDARIVACCDPLDAVLQYKGVESVFRFLHLFLGKLQSSGVTSHFHVDPSAGDPQEINVLKPLFDAVLTIDSVGTHLESG
jgi:CheY-like chemotaxis protein